MDLFNYKHLTIDFLAQQILVNGQPFKLDPKAFATLKLLILEKHRVVGNDELVAQVWENRAVSGEVITAAIARIRKLFKDAGIEENAIRTVHKVGYRFVLSRDNEECHLPINKVEALETKASAEMRNTKPLFFIVSIVVIGFLFYLSSQPSSFQSTQEKASFDAVPVEEEASSFAFSKSDTSSGMTQIYFLRHAEKEFDGTEDPHLSKEGIKHAEYWRKFFQFVEFDIIYSTSFHRNVETAKIVSNNNDEKIKIYSALSFDIVKHLPTIKGKRILIVAHSNTIPGMVNRVVGSNKYGPMSLEDYHSIFQVNIDSNDVVSSQHFYMHWPINSELQ